MYMCNNFINIVSVFTLFRVDLESSLTVWYFLYLILFLWGYINVISTVYWSHQCKRSCMCVLEVSILTLSRIFSVGSWNCSDSVVFNVVFILLLTSTCQPPYTIYPIMTTMWVRIPLRRGILDATLCDKVCQWLAACRWFSPVTSVSSTNKTDCRNITEILMKVALNTITLTYVILELELKIMFDFWIFYKLRHKIGGFGLINIFQPYHFVLKYLYKGEKVDGHVCVW